MQYITIADPLGKKIKELELENRKLKERIKEIHISNEFLEKDINKVKKTLLFKVWQAYRILRNFFKRL